MKRVASALVVIAALGAAVVLMGAKSSGGQSKTIKIVFDNAFGLTERRRPQDRRREGGQDHRLRRDEIRLPPKAIVTAKITQPGFTSFRKDASCAIRPQSLIGEYYVDCQPGTSQQPLPNDTVPVAQTQLDDPAGPRPGHHAPALPRAAAPDHRRAGHRAWRAARRTSTT